MAYSDYCLCSVCGEKTFYDARLNWDEDAPPCSRMNIDLPVGAAFLVSLCGRCAEGGLADAVHELVMAERARQRAWNRFRREG